MTTRIDGRTPDQIRPVNITPGYINTAPGAVLIEAGNTRVICTVSVEERVPDFLVGKGKGWLTAEYSMLPGSSSRRISREVSGGKPNSRGREIQRLIGRSLRAIVDLEAVGERTLYIDCDVIQADGGTRTASITGAYVALALAVKNLRQAGTLSSNPIRQPIAAISAGIVADQVFLDLCYAEDANADTDMNVVMTGDGGLVEIQGTAEGKPFTRAQTTALLDLTESGIKTLIQLQQQALK